MTQTPVRLPPAGVFYVKETKMADFVDGLMAKQPNEKAPDFVKCALSIKRTDLIAWLTGQTDDWINVQVKESKGGKWYAEVDTWKPRSE